jgi:DNA-binding CsgD family transcriptional regulator
LAASNVPLPFTRREHEVVKLLSQGLSNKAIAEATSLSVRTIAEHIYQATTKAGVSTRSELAALVRQFDELEPTSNVNRPFTNGHSELPFSDAKSGREPLSNIFALVDLGLLDPLTIYHRLMAAVPAGFAPRIFVGGEFDPPTVTSPSAAGLGCRGRSRARRWPVWSLQLEAFWLNRPREARPARSSGAFVEMHGAHGMGTTDGICVCNYRRSRWRVRVVQQMDLDHHVSHETVVSTCPKVQEHR